MAKTSIWIPQMTNIKSDGWRPIGLIGYGQEWSTFQGLTISWSSLSQEVNRSVRRLWPCQGVCPSSFGNMVADRACNHPPMTSIFDQCVTFMALDDWVSPEIVSSSPKTLALSMWTHRAWIMRRATNPTMQRRSANGKAAQFIWLLKKWLKIIVIRLRR